MLGLPGSTMLTENEKESRLFEKLYMAYRNRMFAAARSVLSSDEDAEEAVHEAFLRLAKGSMPMLSGLERESDRRNYLLKTVKNTALNMKRGRKTAPGEEDPDICRVDESANVLSDSEFISRICTECRYEQAVSAIKSLSPVYGDVLYYHFVMDLTIPQTARALGRKETTVRKQLVRGKKLLLDLIEKEGDIYDDRI